MKSIFKTIIALILTLSFLMMLSSCSDNKSDFSIETKDPNFKNPFKSGSYAVVNIHSKTIHKDPECYHAKGLSEEYKDYISLSEADSLSEYGYSFCKTCSKFK